MIDKAVPLFDKNGFMLSEIRDKLKVSCSFIKGVRGSKNKTVGVHYNPVLSKNGFHEMMIEPSIDDSIEAVGILIHELTHAIQRHMFGDTVKAHGKEFKKIATAVGLTGKMTATVVSDDLKATIQTWIDEIGKYPHSSLNLSERKKQSTRMIKLFCDNGFIARASRTAIENYGVPYCACCNEPMQVG
jgi:hypothetical protein